MQAGSVCAPSLTPSHVCPVFCVFADRGLFCNPKLRLMTCTYTALFAKGGSLWMWIEFLILSLVFIFHIFLTIRDQPGYTLALALTNITAMPDEEINFYFLYGSEVGDLPATTAIPDLT